jgi:hypothetical protein
VRVEATDADARILDPEFAHQVAGHDVEHSDDALARERARHISQAQMRRRECDPQLAPGNRTGQHHHHPPRAGPLRQVLGMARECNAGIVDHAFVHWRGDDRIEFTLQTTLQRAIERRENVAGVARIEASR